CTSRLLEPIGAGERASDVPGMLMDIARDLARWLLWAALGFERAYIAVELACAIQKRLALMDRAARSEPLLIKYFPEGNRADSFVVGGYNVAQTMVQVLK